MGPPLQNQQPPMKFAGCVNTNRINVVEADGAIGDRTDTRQQRFNYVEEGVTGGMEDPDSPHGDIFYVSQCRWAERIRSAGSFETFEGMVLKAPRRGYPAECP